MIMLCNITNKSIVYRLPCNSLPTIIVNLVINSCATLFILVHNGFDTLIVDVFQIVYVIGYVFQIVYVIGFVFCPFEYVGAD
jgi:hypothetical protein